MTDLIYKKDERDSNLELYRIICMVLIVMHHYVVNSGLLPLLYQDPTSEKSIYYFLFGMWGKTGINCFVLITGYFMCTKKITLEKFLKLLAEIYYYRILFYIIFLFIGKESFSGIRLIKLAMPFWEIRTNFTGCYLLFYLLIPFLSILVQNLNRHQHLRLLIGCLTVYTLLGSIPSFEIRFNYVSWFCILFIVASYFRLYPFKALDNSTLWGWLSLISIMLAIISVIGLIWIKKNGYMAYWFISDSNKLLSVLVSVTTFLWFRGIKIKQSRVINTVAASTFGVFLIHANSDVMREWLWKDVYDVIGHYSLDWMQILSNSLGGVIALFFICILLDMIRKRFFEPILFERRKRTVAI